MHIFAFFQCFIYSHFVTIFYTVRADSNRAGSRFILSDVLFVKRFEAFSRAEKKRNAPDSRDRDQGIDDAAEHRLLTAEEPRYYIKLEKSYASPVESSHDRENKRDSV